MLTHKSRRRSRVQFGNIHGETAASSLLFTGHSVANWTATDAAQQIAGFKRLRGLCCIKHAVNSGKPEAVFISKVVAGAPAVAFKERIGAERPETRTGRGQSLSTAATTGTSVL